MIYAQLHRILTILSGIDSEFARVAGKMEMKFCKLSTFRVYQLASTNSVSGIV